MRHVSRAAQVTSAMTAALHRQVSHGPFSQSGGHLERMSSAVGASLQHEAGDFPVIPGPFDATALGRRQECQTLIGAEIVPKIHTLVRMPRRHATVWLATQALAVEVRPGVSSGRVHL